MGASNINIVDRQVIGVTCDTSNCFRYLLYGFSGSCCGRRLAQATIRTNNLTRTGCGQLLAWRWWPCSLNRYYSHAQDHGTHRLQHWQPPLQTGPPVSLRNSPATDGNGWDGPEIDLANAAATAAATSLRIMLRMSGPVVAASREVGEFGQSSAIAPDLGCNSNGGGLPKLLHCGGHTPHHCTAR